MAAATRPSNNSSPANSKMSSPKDSKKALPVVTKSEEPTKVETNTQEQPTKTEAPTDAKPAPTNAPLAPPPRPAPSTANTNDQPDYFNTQHNPFSLEPNVFEQSFGNPSVETPGRTILPPVANITSPSPIPGITPGGTGWGGSLRSGPLSPAMLTGPASQTDYFSESFRGFPTPNESSLRTGLTPGGGGSMFPQPSPNTQAIFNLQSGGVTPNTQEFLRAAHQASQTKFPMTSAPKSKPETATTMDRANNYQQQPQQAQPQRGQNESFNHDVSNAANDLLSFATQNGGRNGAQSFAVPNQQSNNAGHMPVQPVNHENGRRNTKGSVNSVNGSADTGEFSDSGQSEQKANIRSSRAKKGATNSKQAAGTKRKAEETPKNNSRKAKANNGMARSVEEMMMDEDSEEDTSPKPEGEGGRKMTDEEKRKNFLERNRVAALKCRQRKKQWLANLQAKVELFSTENDALSATVTQLREEIVNLKTLLLAHKDCPVSHAQGLSGMNMNSFLGGEPQHQNPYGIAQMPNGVQMGMPMQAGGQMQNRFVYPSTRVPKVEDEENPPFPENPYLRASS
ncbi:hypothetical protein K491DRAFT_509807 [Lophiostoma macrostomum CBS 122681]|uniref:BZIP domain-containing protein n=1 Tax=Lophiostoma macrostomum CBS 122681 TaxID=1314788 RepID=A0A6A6T3X8_9PLEO|nr:hypothetical protein K491DRAFT_509807 [Lophiostoma macrostomum CBS 122681]